VLDRMGVTNATVHGFRSSFRDWAGNETNFPREVAEHALAHVIGDKAEQARTAAPKPAFQGSRAGLYLSLLPIIRFAISKLFRVPG
jgi:hypothetical protein